MVWRAYLNFNEMNIELIGKVRAYCKELMESSRCQELQFHNWEHTEDVVRNAKFIAKHEQLADDTIEEIIIASYFHDTGNMKQAAGHEKLSCEYAQEFLTNLSYNDQRIINIIYNIMATEMPQQPETISEKVICDADLAHLGKTNFIIKNTNLRKEWDQHCNTRFTDEQWIAMNVQFLKNHSFHSAFAKAHFAKQKVVNIEKLLAIEKV